MHKIYWNLISKPTPIWGGVKSMVVNKNSKYSNPLLTTNDGVTSSRITSTSIIKVITGKGMISKHVPPLMGLIGLVITCCSLGLGPKVNDVALVVLVLVLISIDTKEGGSYLKSKKAVW